MSSPYYPPPPTRTQAPDEALHAPPNPGLHHTASAPPVPPTAMGQHPAPQHPPPTHMLQSPPPPIRTGGAGPIPPVLIHPATAPSPMNVQSPHHPPQGPHQHHHDSFGPPSRTSSAAQMYTPIAAQTYSPPHASMPDTAHVPSPTSRYSPMPPPPPPPSAAGQHPFSPPAQTPLSSPPGSAPGNPLPYNPYAPQSQPQPYNPYVPQSQPQSPESAEPRIPTLAELEARSQGSHSHPSSRHSHHSHSHSRPYSKDERRPGSKDKGWIHHALPSGPEPSRPPQQGQGNKSDDKKPAWKTKATNALGHEGIMDSVELGFEGVVKAASSL